MRNDKITEAHNQCVDILNNFGLTQKELVVTLAQLLIYSGSAITKKEIDIYDMDLDALNKEYYSNNSDNDVGLGLILNGASIMGAIKNSINGNVTANKEKSHDDSLPTTT